MNQKILVTGGAGYIGTHTCVELFGAGYDLVIADNLCNSKRKAVQHVEDIVGRQIPFYQIDIRNREGLGRLFREHSFDAVIHFAGLKAVGESVETPLAYYDTNVAGTLVLIECMADAGVKNLVFSSSATVYGDPQKVPIREDAPLAVTNPYGRTKLIVENVLGDLYQSDPAWRVGILRYFNPVGAHSSGKIGEDPNGKPNNLMPFVAQVAIGRHPALNIYGNDYPTADGTGVRDYIHVCDLAEGHVAAVKRLLKNSGCFTVNLGTGKGYSVLEVVEAFERASEHPIKFNLVGRRAGDVAKCYADPELAKRLLDWSARRGLDQMCQDAWKWQVENPLGFVD